jgi:coproporphyrinogen III oxidase
MNQAQLDSVKHYLLQLQDHICHSLEQEETDGACFIEDTWTRPEGGGGRTRVLTGNTFEQGGVNFSHVSGFNLPASATANRPELANRQYEAMGVSLVIHPKTPMFPHHMQIFAFLLPKKKGKAPFGGLVVDLI